MFAWIIIGVIVGWVMGLTGAGAGVISVPLFVHILGYSLREATVLSLYCVVLGSVFSWVYQSRMTQYRIALLMAAFSAVGSAVAAPIKLISPLWVIQTLFISLVSFGLWNIWQDEKTARIFKGKSPAYWTKIAASGVVLGALTTMTGLGGGVLLMPWLRGPLKLPMSQAVATSLFTIALTAVGSLTVQLRSRPPAIHPLYISLLAVGVLASAITVKALLDRAHIKKITLIRRLVFTAVAIIAILGSIF